MIVGIDLGTTNSLISVFRNGRTELIPNALGHVLTPSAVSLNEHDEVMVGLAARERYTTHPERSALAFKRWMGTEKEISLGSRRFRPEELSALVLRSLKQDAEKYLGESITEAVITVPAYFNEAQRKATKTAGELAGLKVERLLNEPTAAGLAYGLAERTEHRTFLIFDLGGGTFDVSVLEYFEGIVEVRSSAGDTRLGGEDFSAVLAKLFLDRDNGMTSEEKQQIVETKALWRIAEQAKRDLGESEKTTMRLNFKDRVIEQSFSRHDFESACSELLQRLRQPIERALKDAQLNAAGLSEIILVGGASRMPMIRQLITRLFQRLPLRHINPDDTVAHGAAIQAGLKSRDAALDEVVLTDVMPYSLGIVISQEHNGRRIPDRFSPIIERNTPVPVSKAGSYCTLENDQKHILLDIRQGESPIGSENLKLGELEIAVPPLPARQAQVDVRFTYDINGLLEVDAKDLHTGRKVSTVIRQTQDVMSEDEIRAALKKLEALKIHPRQQQENLYLLSRAKRLYEDNLGDVRALILHAMTQFEAALDTQDERIIRPARLEFSQVLDRLDGGFVL